MSEGLTCYERDEILCEDQMCLRVGCRIRNERLANEPRCDCGHLFELIEAAQDHHYSAATIGAGFRARLPEFSAALAELAAVRKQLDECRGALNRLMARTSGKLAQLHDYRDNYCQLDHAKTIADGRIAQAVQMLSWISEEIET